jgi:hypothetical protein
MRNRLEIQDAFKAKPIDKLQQIRLLKIEQAFLDLALDVEDLVPDSADRTAALRDLLKAKFQCVQAITHPVTKGQQTQPTQKGADDGESKKDSK